MWSVLLLSRPSSNEKCLAAFSPRTKLGAFLYHLRTLLVKGFPRMPDGWAIRRKEEEI